jgi:histidinol-phosphate aminotransferase
MRAMISRRNFARVAGGAAAARLFTECAFAQRAAVQFANLPPDMVWLNANENPNGPPPSAIRAAAEALPTTGRYRFQEFRPFYAAVARSQGLDAGQVVVGNGSTEVLNWAVLAFASPSRPLVAMHPTFEGPLEMARALNCPVVRVPLDAAYAADVEAMAAEARKAGAGLVYLCNPNNPTAAVTPAARVAWLAENLPSGAVLLVDEAYIEFADTSSALELVRQGRNVVVTRTFSKIYGMAGMRVGFGCGSPALIGRMAAYRNSVISIVSAQAATAALADAAVVPARRAALLKTRSALCDWLRARNLRFIEPHANFIMIDVGRPSSEFNARMPPLGVAPGRPFPPLDKMLRVTIGTDAEMAKFREVFWKVYQG